MHARATHAASTLRRSTTILNRLAVVAAVLATMIVAGCTAPSPRVGPLVSEDSVAELAALKARTLATGHQTLRVPVGGEGGARFDLAVHRWGSPDQRRAIVAIHGMLADHRAWRFVAGELAQDAQVLLIDLPGAGESDAPRPSEAAPSPAAPIPRDRYGYTMPELARDVLVAIRQTVPDQGTRVTLLAHSLGGQVALRMLSDPELAARFGDVLARIDSAVLIAPLDIAVYRQDPEIRRMARASGLELETAQALGEVGRLTRRRTAESVVPPTPALTEEAEIRALYLGDGLRRPAMQAMVRRAVPWTGPADSRPDWPEMERIEGWYPRIGVPVLLIWGRRDEILPVSMGYKLAAQLPRAELVVMDGVMHSPQIERPEATARQITTFVDRATGLSMPR